MNDVISLFSVNVFLIVLIAVVAPVAAGFLYEAGKELLRSMRKGKEDLTKSLCKDCPLRGEMGEMKKMGEYMLMRQQVLREQTLPSLERSIVEILGEIKLIATAQGKIGNDVSNLYNIWDELNREKFKQG